jgi:hypothetical protein
MKIFRWFEKKELTIKNCKCHWSLWKNKFIECEFHKQCIGLPCATALNVCDNITHMKQNGFDEKGNYIGK